jgi:hypothetical protein
MQSRQDNRAALNCEFRTLVSILFTLNVYVHSAHVVAMPWRRDLYDFVSARTLNQGSLQAVELVKFCHDTPGNQSIKASDRQKKALDRVKRKSCATAQLKSSSRI